MNVFLDTSALLKLYHQEQGTELLDAFLEKYPSAKLVLSGLSLVEFTAAVWKRAARTEDPDFDETYASLILQAFEGDRDRYVVLPPVSDHYDLARRIITRFSLSKNYLRTLDALQLATALAAGRMITRFISFDKKQMNCAKALGLPVEVLY